MRDGPTMRKQDTLLGEAVIAHHSGKPWVVDLKQSPMTGSRRIRPAATPFRRPAGLVAELLPFLRDVSLYYAAPMTRCHPGAARGDGSFER